MMMYGCLIVPSFLARPVYVIPRHSKQTRQTFPFPLLVSTDRPLDLPTIIHSSGPHKGTSTLYPIRERPRENKERGSLSLISSSCLRSHTTPRSKPRSHIYIRVLIPTSPCKHLVPQTLPTVVDFHHTKLTEDVTSRLYNPISSIKENRGNLRRRPSLHHHLRHYSKRTRRCRVAR